MEAPLINQEAGIEVPQELADYSRVLWGQFVTLDKTRGVEPEIEPAAPVDIQPGPEVTPVMPMLTSFYGLFKEKGFSEAESLLATQIIGDFTFSFAECMSAKKQGDVRSQDILEDESLAILEQLIPALNEHDMDKVIDTLSASKDITAAHLVTILSAPLREDPDAVDEVDPKDVFENIDQVIDYAIAENIVSDEIGSFLHGVFGLGQGINKLQEFVKKQLEDSLETATPLQLDAKHAKNLRQRVMARMIQFIRVAENGRASQLPDSLSEEYFDRLRDFRWPLSEDDKDVPQDPFYSLPSVKRNRQHYQEHVDPEKQIKKERLYRTIANVLLYGGQGALGAGMLLRMVPADLANTLLFPLFSITRDIISVRANQNIKKIGRGEPVILGEGVKHAIYKVVDFITDTSDPYSLYLDPKKETEEGGM